MLGVVLDFETHPDTHLHVFLFTKVKNTKNLYKRLVEKDLPFDIAFINASLVPDLFIIHSSASKALIAKFYNDLRCNSLTSEIVCNLSGTKQISQSLRTFGISESEIENMIVAAFDLTDEKIEFIIKLIDGDMVSFNELPYIIDEKKIKNIYKITEEELSIGSLADAIICRIAAHDIDLVK